MSGLTFVRLMQGLALPAGEAAFDRHRAMAAMGCDGGMTHLIPLTYLREDEA